MARLCFGGPKAEHSGAFRVRPTAAGLSGGSLFLVASEFARPLSRSEFFAIKHHVFVERLDTSPSLEPRAVVALCRGSSLNGAVSGQTRRIKCFSVIVRQGVSDLCTCRLLAVRRVQSHQQMLLPPQLPLPLLGQLRSSRQSLRWGPSAEVSSPLASSSVGTPAQLGSARGAGVRDVASDFSRPAPRWTGYRRPRPTTFVSIQTSKQHDFLTP